MRIGPLPLSALQRADAVGAQARSFGELLLRETGRLAERRPRQMRGFDLRDHEPRPV